MSAEVAETGRLPAFIAPAMQGAPLVGRDRELDTLREEAASQKLGTTKRGIGPAYEDKVGRRAIRAIDLKDLAGLPAKIERLLATWSKGRKLYGPLYDDLLKLKYLHQRYTNYLNWLKTQ